MVTIKGKVALITGGAGGIGLCMVKDLLRNGLQGVAIVDISDEAGQKAISEVTSTFGEGKAIFLKTDVTDGRKLEEAFESTIRFFGQLDIVVNNAGVVDEYDWEKVLAVNFKAVVQGTYLAQQNYLPKYKSGDEGIIVNIASMLGLSAIQSCPMYCATKSGVISLGQSLGGEKFYEKYKVRVLTICPGATETPMLVSNANRIFFPEQFELDDCFGRQKPEEVARALIKILNEGKNGSIWAVEPGSPPYEVRIPHWKSINVQNQSDEATG